MLVMWFLYILMCVGIVLNSYGAMNHAIYVLLMKYASCAVTLFPKIISFVDSTEDR